MVDSSLVIIPEKVQPFVDEKKKEQNDSTVLAQETEEIEDKEDKLEYTTITINVGKSGILGYIKDSLDKAKGCIFSTKSNSENKLIFRILRKDAKKSIGFNIDGKDTLYYIPSKSDYSL